MAELTLVLPEGIKKRFGEETEKQGKALEELMVESFSKVYGLAPEVKAEFHSDLCEKYLMETADSLDKEFYTKASGKAWGAASHMVKAVASKRGIDIKSPAELFGFVAVLKTELEDPELTKLLAVAEALHRNFNTGELPPEVVADYAEAIIRFIEKLRELI